MTSLEQDKAVAEWLGWQWVPPDDLIHPNVRRFWRMFPGHSDPILREMECDLPEFGADLNPMNEAENRLPDHLYLAFHNYLTAVRNNRCLPICRCRSASAEERREAFVKAIGRWKGAYELEPVPA